MREDSRRPTCSAIQNYDARLTRAHGLDTGMDRRNSNASFSSVSVCMILSTDTRDVTLRDSGPFQISHAYRSSRAVLPPGWWNTIIALLAPGTCTSTPHFVPSGPRNGLICLAIAFLGGGYREWLQTLPPDKSCVNLVPVHHARLAQLPAVENLAAIQLPAKINQPDVHPLADDAELGELSDVALDILCQALRLDLQELGDHIRTLRTRRGRRKLEFADLLLP